MLYKVVDSSLFINGKVVHIGETVDLPETFAESIIRFLKPVNSFLVSSVNNSEKNNSTTKQLKNKIKNKIV